MPSVFRNSCFRAFCFCFIKLMRLCACLMPHVVADKMLLLQKPHSASASEDYVIVIIIAHTYGFFISSGIYYCIYSLLLLILG